MFGVGTAFRRSHTSFFSNAPLPASNNFWTKVQLTRKSFVSTNILLSLIIFFNLLYNISKISLPPCSRFSYKELNGWEFGRWLTANFTSLAVTWKNIVRSFSMPLWSNKHLPGQSASIIIAFEFFGMFVSTRTPSIFLVGGKVVLVFEIIYLFIDLQVIFYGQMTSTINSIFF